jgi:hypothetical protein
VTFVNGEWQGDRPMQPDHVDESLRSCSLEWEFLRDAGSDGWELVGLAQGIGGDNTARVLYLRRGR